LERDGNIRVLRITPWNIFTFFYDPLLNMELIEINLAKVPRGYDPISHRWKDADKYQTAYIDGYAIKIPHHMRTMVLSLRDYLSLIVWIDSLCINQPDLSEKPKQVLMMRDIYREGSYVCGYIPASPFQGYLACQLIPGFKGSVGLLSPKDLEVALLHPTKSGAWTAFRALISDEFFTRVWIVQEVVLPGRFTILYCNVPIEFKDLLRFCEHISEEPQYHAMLMTGTIGTGTVRQMILGLGNILTQGDLHKSYHSKTPLSARRLLLTDSSFRAVMWWLLFSGLGRLVCCGRSRTSFHLRRHALSLWGPVMRTA
jgi:hypothetical protein